MNDGALPFEDRRAAGRLLAPQLEHLHDCPALLILGLARGGVPVAFEVARALQGPLDVLVVRKLGFPGHAEYAMGAIAGGGVQVMNPAASSRIDPDAIAAVVAREQDELTRRERLYRDRRPPIPPAGRTVIVVDDGLATGSTMRAAVLAVRRQHPARLVVAVPVGTRDACDALRPLADEVVCGAMPEPFEAVGLWYRHFPQTPDDEVRSLLEEARREHELDIH
jgi:putative phosphoribosyl transferase